MKSFKSKKWTVGQIVLVCLFSTLSIIPLKAQIRGKVFKDVNKDGSQTLATEIGVSNIKIKATNTGGEIFETLSDISGNFSFPAALIPTGTDIRIEFIDLLGEFASYPGMESNSSVQFVKAGSNAEVNLGILSGNDYCPEDGLKILTSCYINGDPLLGGSAANEPAVVNFDFKAQGLAGVNGSPYPTTLSANINAGSVWGTVYQKRGKTYLITSLVRRHSGLGPLGTGGIYTYNTSNDSFGELINVKSLGIDTGPDMHTALPGNYDVPSEDSLIMHYVGKTGLGSIAMGEDEKTVYITNLFDKKLYTFEVGVPVNTVLGNVNSYNIPNNCPNGDMVPWALKEYKGSVYVGTVCTAETSQDRNELHAYVYAFDEKLKTFKQVFDFPLDYIKGPSDATGTCGQYDKWNPWTTKWPDGCAHYYLNGKKVNFVMYPQPILASLEFDLDGSLILGFMDKFGLNAGQLNYRPRDNGELYNGFVGGDLLRAQFDPSANSFTLENNGTSGNLVGYGSNTGEGPGGGEFYGRDYWLYFGNKAHNEITNGGVLILPESGNIITSAMDPVDEIIYSGGVRTFDRTNGDLVRSYALYAESPSSLGKAGGIGDLKAACGPAPIAIGNRIWNDINKNGIQDPEEPGIAGVSITLYDGNTLVGTAITNNQGYYYFTDENVLGGILFEHDYEIRFNLNQSVLSANNLSQFTSQNLGINDELDSDMPTSGVLIFKSGLPAQSNYSFDIGLNTCTKPNAGNDFSICMPGGAIQLNPQPSGGTWNLLASNPSVLTIDQSNLLNGVFNPGIYQIEYQLNGCSDTLNITVNANPKAEDATFCMPQNSTILTASPTGGVWNVLLGNPSEVVLGATSGNVNGMTNPGVYRFTYSLLGCSDTATVDLKPKPSAGNDITGVCTSVGSATLSALPAGGTWSVASGNPTNATISPTGAVAGMNTVGSYSFIYTLNACSDTVSVTTEFCPLASMGDFAWYDLNRNGIQDNRISPTGAILGPELPALGIIMEIYSAADNSLLGKDTTDANGKYLFDKLQPGSYYVKFNPSSYPDPAFAVTTPNKVTANDSLDSDIPPAVYQSANFSLVNGQHDPRWDIGFFRPSDPTITDPCACDEGIVYQTGTPFPTTYAYRETVSVQATPGGAWMVIPQKKSTGETTTGVFVDNGEGFVRAFNPTTEQLFMDEIAPGEYELKFAHFSEDGYTLVVTDGIDTLSIGAVCFETKEPADFHIGSICAYDEPYVLKTDFTEGTATYYFIADTAFSYVPNFDENLIREAALLNPPISSINPKDFAAGTTISLYVAWEPKPNSIKGGSCSKTIFQNVQITGDTACTVKIGDYVWCDINKNGIQESTDTPVANVIVELYEVNAQNVRSNTVYRKDTTNAQGKYLFELLPPGKYQVRFVPSSVPTDKEFSNLPYAGNDPTKDSNVNPLNGFTEIFEVTLAQKQNLSIDASIQYICDKPDGGTDKEFCMPVSAPVFFNAVSSGGTWAALSGNPANATITSNGVANGFTSAGTYRFVYAVGTCKDTVNVVVRPKPNAGLDLTYCMPVNNSVILNSESTDGIWSAAQGNPANANITSNGIATGFTSAGIYKFIYSVSTCSDTMNVDIKPKPDAGSDITGVCTSNGTATLSALPAGGSWRVAAGNPANATISPTGAVAGMNAVGKYSFIYTLNACSDTVSVTTEFCPLASMGDFAWYDLNRNGIQDNRISPTGAILGPELPALGIIMEIYSAADNSLLGKDTTDANGKYLFDKLQPGSYYVKFNPSSYPDPAFAVTTPNKATANDSLDSDIPPAVYQSTNFSLVNGQHDPRWDIGFFRPADPTITDPCVCNEEYIYALNSPNGTRYLFSETVTVKATPGGEWITIPIDLKTGKKTENIHFLDAEKDLKTFDAADSTLVMKEISLGMYELRFNHFSDIGYNLVVTDGVDTLNIGAICNERVESKELKIEKLCFNQKPYQLSNTFSEGIATHYFVADSAINFKENFDENFYRELALNNLQITEIDPSNYSIGTQISIFSKWQPFGVDTLKGSFCPKSLIQVIEIIGTDVCFVEIGDRVWCDTNKDGLQDATDTGVGNVMVELYQVNEQNIRNNNVYRKDTTDTAGKYLFDLLAPGKYQIRFVPSSISDDKEFSNKPFTGSDSTRDSNVNPNNGFTDIFEISLAQKMRLDIDAGLQYKCDKPNAGLDQSFCLPILNSVMMNPISIDGTWSALSGNPANATITSNGIANGFTAAGIYRFEYAVGTCKDTVNVEVKPKPNAGTDQIAFVDYSTYKLTGLPSGGTWSQLSGNPSGIILNANNGNLANLTSTGTYGFVYSLNGCTDTVNIQAYQNQDFSYCLGLNTAQLNAAPSGGTYKVLNGNPSNATINNTGYINGLDSVGVYLFEYTVQGVRDTISITMSACDIGEIGDYIWFDENKNGIQDPNESAVPGVILELCKVDNQGNTLTYNVGIDTTDTNGNYRFTGLASGNYLVKIKKTSIPQGYEITPNMLAGTNLALDNNFNNLCRSDVIIIDTDFISLRQNLTIDAGLIRKECIQYCIPIAIRRIQK